MKIIEYSNKYAQQVADMWNKSGSNWGDDSSVKTAQDVILEESNSGNLKLFIALDNDQVVGYCSFSEYEHDEGASYLPLLNVRPDYHGKKVGKALILRTIQEAVKAPWPRFDLFTWSGNIKAMPLYKKCGFFWEKNNESVHLMNFLPYIYQTEALESYMNQIDWYQDQKRVIDMNQDGVMKNGHDTFTYNFKNEKTDVTLEFERSGRGLHFIDTPDYSIRMSIPKQELVYDETYEVTFHIENRKDELLNIELNGVDNKNIISSFNEVVLVKNEKTIVKDFTVSKTEEKYDKWNTNPVVEVDVLINGKKATMKLGVNPKSPLTSELIVNQYNHILGETYKAYLNLQNNLDNETTFALTFNSDIIEVCNDLSVTLNHKGKKSLVVEYKVKEFGFINEMIQISYNGKTIENNVKSLVKGHEGTIHGEDDKNIYLVDGNYKVTYEKEHNRVWASRLFRGNAPVALVTPQIGLPFNKEFANLKPEFRFASDNELQVTLPSKEFKDVYLHITIHNQYGLMKVNYQLENKGEDKVLALNIPVFKPFNDTLVPYDGKILRTTRKEGGGAGSLDSSKIDENWLFDEKDKVGFTWPKSQKLIVSGWRFSVSKDNISLKKGESYHTGEFVVSFVHKDVKRFRAFSGNFKELDYMRFISLNINGGNPFVANSQAPLQLINERKTELKGTISDGLDKVDLAETLHLNPGLSSIKVDAEDRIMKVERMLFDVKGETTLTENDGIYTVDNGLITYKVSPEYNDGVYSLLFNGQEWLDSNYPEPKERAWWGTFTGGINVRQSGQQDHIALKEKRTAEFVSLKDNFGNLWEGIKTTLTFEVEEDFKGLIHENYYLTLPGVPLLHTFTKIINNTGKFINDQYYVRYNVLKVDEVSTNVFYEFDGVTYKCGNVGIEKNPEKFVQLQSTRDHKLSIYNKKNELEMDTQKQYTCLFSDQRMSIADNDTAIFTGDFIILSKEKLTQDSLIDLENIRFEV